MSQQAAILNQLLDAALQLPRAERAAFVDGLGPEYDAVKPRLRALLARGGATDERDGSFETLPKLSDGRASIAAAAPAARAPGHRVGPYELVRRLGSGGMGEVWLAHADTPSGSARMALKFAHATPHRSDLATRLARERALLSALAHPNIARLYDTGLTDEQQLYLVLEYVEGEPLDVYCVRREASLLLRLTLVLQVAEAVTHAHERRIVHRDLKPENVLITASGEARLLDFGVGKLLGDDGTLSHQQLSQLWGRPLTPEYASPEQLLGGEVGLGSDIYSLGVMLYELLAGVRPFADTRGSHRALRAAILDRAPLPPSEATTDPERSAQLKDGLDAVVLRALHRRPEQRYASMNEFAREIEHHARIASRRAHGER